MNRHIIPILLVLDISVRCAVAAESPADPMSWSPPKVRPELRKTLDDDVFNARLAAALKNMDIAALEKNPGAAYGLEVISVVPGSQSEVLGVEVGDVIVELGGQEIGRFTELVRQRTPQAKTMIVQRGGQRSTFDIGPDKLGLTMKNLWKPQLTYARGSKRNAAWDRQMLAASVSIENDPALAEAALFRAAAAGYVPDAFFDVLCAQARFSLGDLDNAMGFAWFATQAEPKSVVAARLFFWPAVSNYKLEAALESLKRFPFLGNADALKALIAEHQALPVAERLAPEPAATAAKAVRDDIPMQEGFYDPHKLLKDNGFEDVFFERNLNYISAPEMGGTIIFKHGVSNGETEFWFRTRTVENVNPDFGFVEFGWYNKLEPGFAPTGMAMASKPAFGLMIFSSNWMALRHSCDVFGIGYNTPLVKANDPALSHLKIRVWHGRGEIYLNEKRIFYGPVPMKGVSLVPFITFMQSHLDIERLSCTELFDGDARLKLIKANADARGELGISRLHRATASADLARMKELLAWGANPNVQDTTRQLTPLHIAAQGGDLDAARILLAAKADVKIRDMQGRTPLDMAEAEKKEAMIKFLKDNGAKKTTGEKAGDF